MAKVRKLYDALYKVTKNLINALQREEYEETWRDLREATDESFVLDEDGEWRIGQITLFHDFPLHPRDLFMDHILSMDETEDLCTILVDGGFV